MKLVFLLFSLLANFQCDGQLSNLGECQMRTTFHCGGDETPTSGGLPSRGLPGKRGQKGESGADGERGITGETGKQGVKGEPGVGYNITEIEHLKHDNRKIKKKLHISSNHTEQLERELKQLKEEHQNLTVDYEQLKSNHQNLTDGHMKLEENYDQFKNLIYAYMGGKPCVVENFEIKNGSISDIVGNLIPTGTKLSVVCDPGYHFVEENPVCQDGTFSKISKVKDICKPIARDCNDVKKTNSDAQNGVYTIKPFEDVTRNLEAFCHFDSNNNGWTVLQKRTDSSTSFKRNWSDYVAGFGEKTGNHWLGLENMYALLKDKDFVLRIELEAHNGETAYAEYDEFYLGSESEKFALHVGQYSGTAGDSLTYHNGMRFTTTDQDNDTYGGNCATEYGGAGGWWFNYCRTSTLNGEYQHSSKSDVKYMYWDSFNGGYSIKTSVMMVKRKN